MPIRQIPLGVAVATVHSLQVTSVVRESVTLVVPRLSTTAVSVNTTSTTVTSLSVVVVLSVPSVWSIIEKTFYVNIRLQLIAGRLGQLTTAFPPKSQSEQSKSDVDSTCISTPPLVRLL